MGKVISTQDLFLKQVKKENIYVTVYLLTGTQLKGIIKSFDSFVILIESNDKRQTLVYKHSITSIVPSKPINMEFSDLLE